MKRLLLLGACAALAAPIMARETARESADTISLSDDGLARTERDVAPPPGWSQANSANSPTVQNVPVALAPAQVSGDAPAGQLGPRETIAALPLLNPNRFGNDQISYSGTYITPAFQFGHSDRASIGVEVPLIHWGNPCGESADPECERDGAGKFRKVFPRVLALSGGVSTSLTKGEGILFKRAEHDDFDYLSGTSVRFGFDWYGFEPRSFGKIREDAADYIIAKLRPKCQARYGFESEKCRGAELAQYAFAKDQDGKYIETEAVDAITNMYFRAPPKADRRWGIGASVSYSSVDYSFVDGFVTEVVDDDGMISLEPILTGNLPAATTETRDNWLFEVHGYTRLPLEALGRPMLTVQLQRKEQFSFRDGAGQNICSQTEGTGFTIQKCEERFLEKPVYNPETILSLGTRWRIKGLPFEVGFAPQWRYVFESDQRVWDFPLYLGSKNELNGGIRLRRKRGGTDLLGNPLEGEDQILIFFTPFTFHGF